MRCGQVRGGGRVHSREIITIFGQDLISHQSSPLDDKSGQTSGLGHIQPRDIRVSPIYQASQVLSRDMYQTGQLFISIQKIK